MIELERLIKIIMIVNMNFCRMCAWDDEEINININATAELFALLLGCQTKSNKQDANIKAVCIVLHLYDWGLGT
jgi:hypothetical protein